MRRMILSLAAAVALSLGVNVADSVGQESDWSMNATVIEACSCPMFCQCYFNSKPAAHGGHGHGDGEHFCKFNNAYKVNRGQYGSVKLDGTKFWLSGDLGDEFADGEMEWSVMTFDKATTPEQRQALSALVRQLFPVKWKSFKTADGDIDWKADKDMAHATLDGGKTAEVKLKRFQGMSNEPVVIKNLKYWGAPRNDGFVLMPNEVEAYRVGDKPFEFKGTNGFMVTFDMSSKDTTQVSQAR